MHPRLLITSVLLLLVAVASSQPAFRHPEMALRYSGPSPFRLLSGGEIAEKEVKKSAKVDTVGVDAKTRLFLLFLQSIFM
ncbi:hypothetical protein QR680_018201 [Steinernema hermaphroditum]|uniref:Uncharacterized protein n=1 Tax=Steinernema hermaphroditum TaxID=289476 RepID=A0AA39LPZ4_9BILA|nr:hypothetical protein QR680_018201 [Steinernema hermaphroditum]